MHALTTVWQGFIICRNSECDFLKPVNTQRTVRIHAHLKFLFIQTSNAIESQLLYQLTIAELCCRTRGICFSIASHHCSIPDWHDVGSSLVFSKLSSSYKGADETFFILMQSEVNGASSSLSSKGSSVPLNPDIARRDSSKTWYNWHQESLYLYV